MRHCLSLFLLAAMLIMMPHASKAQELSDAETSEIENLIRNYLLENGEVIMESVNNYQTKMMEEQQAAAQEKAKDFVAGLDERSLVAAIGPDDASVTVVEFFDYNCGYCHRALEEIQTVLEDDKDVRFVFMDLPILHQTSTTSAKYGLAAAKQDKYWEYHQAIMAYEGEKTAENLLMVADKTGLDTTKLKNDAESKEIENILSQNQELAREMGFSGTPGFIIGGELIPGYVPAAALQEQINSVRSEG